MRPTPQLQNPLLPGFVIAPHSISVMSWLSTCHLQTLQPLLEVASLAYESDCVSELQSCYYAALWLILVHPANEHHVPLVKAAGGNIRWN